MAATLVGGAALGLLLARALGGLVAVLLVATATHSALSQLGLRSRFLPLIATLVMWLGLEALIWHPPAGWYALEWANRGLLLPAEALLQRRLELGPSASGAYCVALFGLYGLSAHLAASRRDRRRLGRYLLALWVAQCAYVALLLSVADGSLGSLAMRASRLLNLDTGQFALFGLLSLVAGAHWAAVELATLPAGACGRPVGARWTAWGLLTLATLALCAPPRETAGAATVGFLVQGQD